MCDNFRPIRDLDVVMKDNKYLRFSLPENRVNANIFYDKCNKTKVDNMNTNQFQYNMSLYQFQNVDRIEPLASNFINISNDLERKPKNSCM